MGFNPPRNSIKNHEKVIYNPNFNHIYDSSRLLSIHEGF